MYGGITCALKQQDYGKIVYEHELEKHGSYVYTVQDFQRECLLHSELHHPNIVKMYGVCYHSQQPAQPIKVMELVEGGTLSMLLNTHHAIPMYVKLSLLQDVSRGVHYLHTHNPPIIHCHLITDVILLTSTLTAKIGSFTFAQEVMNVESVSKLSNQVPLYHSSLSASHGFSFDVFFFGYVVCQVVTQTIFGHLFQDITDLDTDKLFVTCHFTHLQQYLDYMSKGPLKQLVMQCFADDPTKRPSISHVCETIDVILNGELTFFVTAQLLAC